MLLRSHSQLLIKCIAQSQIFEKQSYKYHLTFLQKKTDWDVSFNIFDITWDRVSKNKCV